MAKKPKCAICAGCAPFAIDELVERQGVQEEAIWFRYAGRVETSTFHSFVGGATIIEQARRLTDSKSEIVIELHDCLDEGRLVFQVRGPLPDTEGKKDRLEFFLRYAFRLRETRGQGRRRNDLTMERIFEAIRNDPGASDVLLAADLRVSLRTLQRKLQKERLTLKDARESVLGGGKRSCHCRAWKRSMNAGSRATRQQKTDFVGVRGAPT